MSSSPSYRSLPIIKLDYKPVMKITEEFNLKIDYMCKCISNIEWSGVLFFNVEGNLKEGLTIIPVDIYPMDKGNGSYTEYDFTEEVFDYYDKYPDRFGMKYGHIHSHHSMGSFFSGTDVRELVDNCVNHSYYVSLIVNNKNEMVARIAIAGERKIKSSSLYSFNDIRELKISIPKDEDSTETVMYYADIEIEKSIPLIVTKANELLAPKPRFVATGGMNFGGFDGYDESFMYERRSVYPDKSRDIVIPDMTERPEYNALEIFSECLGGPNESLTEIFDYALQGWDNYTSEKEAIEDLTEYVEASMNYDSISEEMRQFHRDYFTQPNMEDVLTVMKNIRSLVSPFKNSNSRHKLLADIVDVVLNKEIIKLQSYEKSSI